MSWARLPADFSAWTLSRKVKQRFGLQGFARLVCLVELLAGSPERDAGRVSLPLADWRDALECGDADLFGFLNYLSAADFLGAVDQSAAGGPLVVVISNPSPFLPGSADPALFRKPCEWATWCEVELGFPPAVLVDPYTQQLFRRWVAVNVTTEEMTEAAQQAIATEQSLSPAALNGALAKLRADRLERAKR